MKKDGLDILACPIDKNYPLELYAVRSDADIIIDGALFCNKCYRFYRIIGEIPIMLPDELRDKNNDLQFLQQYRDKLPAKIINSGKPWHLM